MRKWCGPVRPTVDRLFYPWVLQDAELQASFRAAGVDAAAMVQPELGGYMRAEYEKWGRVVRETGAMVN